MTPAEMIAALALRSARAEPIVPEGGTEPSGYTLRGPRGNKRVVAVDEHGNVDGFAVRLWLAMLDYSDARAAKRPPEPDREDERPSGERGFLSEVRVEQEGNEVRLVIMAGTAKRAYETYQELLHQLQSGDALHLTMFGVPKSRSTQRTEH